MMPAGGHSLRPSSLSVSIKPSSTTCPSFGSLSAAVRSVNFSKEATHNNGGNIVIATGGAISAPSTAVEKQPGLNDLPLHNIADRSDNLGFPCGTMPNHCSIDGNLTKGNIGYGKSDGDPIALLAGTPNKLGFPNSSHHTLHDSDESPPTIAHLVAQINDLNKKLAGITGATESHHARRRSHSKGRRSQSRGGRPRLMGASPQRQANKGTSWSHIVQKEGLEAPGNPAKQMALQYSLHSEWTTVCWSNLRRKWLRKV